MKKLMLIETLAILSAIPAFAGDTGPAAALVAGLGALFYIALLILAVMLFLSPLLCYFSIKKLIKIQEEQKKYLSCLNANIINLSKILSGMVVEENGYKTGEGK